MKPLKIARITTVPFALQNHLRGQICATLAAGYDLTLISSNGPEVALLSTIPGVRFHPIEIPRKISLLHDLAALWHLFNHFRRERYDIVHSMTPKAGMLTAIAAFLAGIPIRLHTFTGQPWMEMRGIYRRLVKAGDQVTARLVTHCYADSFSQREFLLAERVVLPQHITVIGSGSLAGVDLVRFDPEVWRPHRKSILSDLGIAPDIKVICFIGRLTRDKGIEELVTAFDALRADGMKCVLLLVGPQESDWGKLSPVVRQSIENDTGILSVGYSSEPERYLAVTDIFCLPSYREGFGNVVIEAAAMGVASVGTDIVGLRDAVVDGETGLLVPPKDVTALAAALSLLLTDDEQRERMGRKAYARVSSEFDAHLVNAAVVAEYQKLWAGMEKAKSKRC